ncbi:MAG: hypothetical protein HC897_01090 [Thermoanaerobaculia bacterium]|nr:hypothetical protein [Thermoanaerobaculia bacterium]
MADALTQDEQDLLDAVPAALRSGIELLEWWRKTDAADSYAYRYPETQTLNRPEDKSFGFFDTVELSTGSQRINGNVQDMFYDEPKASPTRSAKPGSGPTSSCASSSSTTSCASAIFASRSRFRRRTNRRRPGSVF